MGNAKSAPAYEELAEAKQKADAEVSRLHQWALVLHSAALAAEAAAKAKPGPEIEAAARKSSKLAVAGGKDPFFFDRQEETDKLLGWLGSKPNTPLLLIGPKDTGKTMLLKHVQAICEKFVPVLRIDLRGLQHNSPKSVAEEIKDQLFDWLDAFLAVLGGAETAIKEGNDLFGKFSCASNFPLFPKELVQHLRMESERSEGLGELISCLRKFVYKNGAHVVIMLDEADCLKTWQGSHEAELRQLLQFLAWMTKQEGRNQVLLASSDDFFRRWLYHQGGLEYQILGLGNFDKDEAKNYFRTHCYLGNRLGPGYETWEPEWNNIFEVTGGSPSQLKRIAQSTTVDMLDWSTAVEAIKSTALDNLSSVIDEYVQEGANEDRALAELKVALETMVAGKGLVPMEVMVLALSKCPQATGSRRRLQQAVWKMVEHNVFHSRPRNEVQGHATA